MASPAWNPATAFLFTGLLPHPTLCCAACASTRRDFGMSAYELTPMAYRERVGDAEVRSSA
jgi:hypothetical protein